ncbi:unnamed protein product [Amoebophrya sp. A25]|nr:unnamed protein product [Amoebophrya sp. A25]|eukprot:GSA25T00006397001.1
MVTNLAQELEHFLGQSPKNLEQELTNFTRVETALNAAKTAYNYAAGKMSSTPTNNILLATQKPQLKKCEDGLTNFEQTLQKLTTLREAAAAFDDAKAAREAARRGDSPQEVNENKTLEDWQQNLTTLRQKKTAFDDAKAAYDVTSSFKTGVGKYYEAKKRKYEVLSRLGVLQSTDNEATRSIKDKNEKWMLKEAEDRATQTQSDLDQAEEDFISARDQAVKNLGLNDLSKLATHAENFRKLKPPSPSDLDSLKAEAYWDMVSGFMYAVSNLGAVSATPAAGGADSSSSALRILMESRRELVGVAIDYSAWSDAQEKEIFSETLPTKDPQDIGRTDAPFRDFALTFALFMDTFEADGLIGVQLQVGGSKYAFSTVEGYGQGRTSGKLLLTLDTVEVALLVALNVLQVRDPPF